MWTFIALSICQKKPDLIWTQKHQLSIECFFNEVVYFYSEMSHQFNINVMNNFNLFCLFQSLVTTYQKVHTISKVSHLIRKVRSLLESLEVWWSLLKSHEVSWNHWSLLKSHEVLWSLEIRCFPLGSKSSYNEKAECKWSSASVRKTIYFYEQSVK